ncbi:BamA/TamA family outer membrane protein [Chitinasiproducens palmae]|uniref:Surface antigen n=1 Tax=Chitinasiproducens palmae TaxID=1770053 RepID=A0A1H2PIX5_9BURK|nr:BamA/TamA family outer membrane protein [Chitinasiproducens palmae]SDV46217.1 Surface antigen [Chitinasiproducens palmae]
MTSVRRFTLAAGLCCSLISSITTARASDASPAPAADASATEPRHAAPPSPGPERLELGAAVDSESGLIGSAYVGKNNLIPGVFTFATFRYARETQRGQAGLFKPNAFGERVDAGVDFNYRRDAYDDQGFCARTYGIEPYVQFHIGAKGVLTTGLGYRVQTVDHLAGDAPLSFRHDEGTRSGVYLRASYALDKFVDTTRLTMSADLDNHLYNLASGRDGVFQSEGRLRTKVALVPDSLSLLNIVRVGYMHAVGGGSPSVADRFFIGGVSLRGFEPRHVGPRDGNYFAGGDRYATASLDVIKKVGTLLGSAVSISVFTDVGSLWGGDLRPDAAADTRAVVRASAGVAVTFSVAGLPVSLYAAKPFRKQREDVEQNFGMSVSMRF